MSDATTRKMQDAFFQDAEPTGFLAGLFTLRPRGLHNSEEVEIDIQRATEHIAIPVINGHGYNVMTLDPYTNKSFKPPVYKTESPLRGDDLYTREPGIDPFQDQAYQAKLTSRAMLAGQQLMAGLQRAIELQCSQVLQTGIVDLKGADGVTRFTLDFGMRASHKIAVGTAWDQPGADPLADLNLALEVIRNDGKLDANQVIMDTEAFEACLRNTEFLAAFDNRRVDIGSINPMPGEGGTGGGNYRGTVDIGNYKVDIWTYGGRYTDPQTGNMVNYIDQGNVIVRSSRQRLDKTFGSIPLVLPPDRRLARFLPRRMSSLTAGIDVFTNVWADTMGETLHIGVGARPLMIPVQIDGHATLSGTVTP